MVVGNAGVPLAWLDGSQGRALGLGLVVETLLGGRSRWEALVIGARKGKRDRDCLGVE